MTRTLVLDFLGRAFSSLGRDDERGMVSDLAVLDDFDEDLWFVFTSLLALLLLPPPLEYVSASEAT